MQINASLRHQTERCTRPFIKLLTVKLICDRQSATSNLLSPKKDANYRAIDVAHLTLAT